MPPKAKFTKEEIIAAALKITREQGIGAVTARELGARLGSSARPVFTVFSSMEELTRENLLRMFPYDREFVSKLRSKEVNEKSDQDSGSIKL